MQEELDLERRRPRRPEKKKNKRGKGTAGLMEGLKKEIRTRENKLFVEEYKYIYKNLTEINAALQHHWSVWDFCIIFFINTRNLSHATKSNPVPSPMSSCPITFFAWSISTQLISPGQLENWPTCVKAGRPGKRLQPKHESQFVKQDEDSLTVRPERGSNMNNMMCVASGL